MRVRMIFASLVAATFILIAVLASARYVTSASLSDQTGQAVQASAAEIANLRSDDSGIHFTLKIPNLELTAEGELLSAGLSDKLALPGKPVLPYHAILFAVPNGKIPRVQARPMDSVTYHQIHLVIAGDSTLSLEGDSEGFPTGTSSMKVTTNGNKSFLNDFNLSTTYPGKLYELSEVQSARGLRVAKLNIFPVQYLFPEGELTRYKEINVDISFQPSNGSEKTTPLPSREAGYEWMFPLLLNGTEARNWPSNMASEQESLINLPIEQDVFKIQVDSDGIYEISQQELAAAGMDVTNVDPNSIEMMYRGQHVAYQFIGNGNNSFEAGESIRFYGWSFRGSRLDRQFINNNIFWLWGDGNGKIIKTKPSITGTPVHETYAMVTREPEISWFPGYTDQWDQFPNEPDAWYWDLIATSSTPISREYSIELNHPAQNGALAKFTAEVSSRGIFGGPPVYHTLNISMNSILPGVTQSWWDEKNLNLQGTVPLTSIINGENGFLLTATSQEIVNPNPGACTPCIALNRITVEYLRELISDDDELAFEDQAGGNREFWLRGFSQPDSANIIIWDVSDQYSPIEISSNSVTISGTNPYTYIFGSDHLPNAKFHATTINAIKNPVSIDRYTPINLDPPLGADWVAISHHSFISELDRLAAHRQDKRYGGYGTHIVNIDDVINQYGYGLPLPSSIRDYLYHAVTTWQNPPHYALLVGDATRDPRHLNSNWTDPQYLPTDIVFEDPWQGQIPSDLPISLFDGELDILPDIALGRLAVKEPAELAVVVDKIIQYEQNQLQSFAWMQNILFVADDTDVGGDFCTANQAIAEDLPDSMNSMHLCLDDYTGSSSARGAAIRADLFENVNDIGATIVNYRGHGSIGSWAGDPVILAANYFDSFANNFRPFVAISGDCLDGKFTSPPTEGLGEMLIRASNASGVGVAASAHWGSAGLGVTSEHSRMINAFYDGFFLNGLTTIGDATTYAKVKYGLLPDSAPSLLYSFILQGDPAMQLLRPALHTTSNVNPIVTTSEGQLTFQIQVENQGVFPAFVTVTHQLPPGIQLQSVDSSVSTTYELIGNSVVFDLQFGDGQRNKGIPRNHSATVILTTSVDGLSTGKYHSITSALGTGLEAWPGDEQAISEFFILERASFLPLITQ